MELSKGFTATEYNKLDFRNDAAWDTAIGVLSNRLIERYIEPADRLIELEHGIHASKRKYGFTILAIDCLLIETLQSFYEGVPDSIGKSKRFFRIFLMTRQSFKSHFPTDAEANFFYDNFRCGILHQAQTFNNTKVRAIGKLISQEGMYTIVNRISFHEAVKWETQEYIRVLKSKANPTLLKRFKIKMDFIANS